LFCLALEVQLNATERERIPAGVRIHIVKASRGSYIRTPDGKFFAIRQSLSAFENGSKQPSMLPPAPPPPPPPPPPPSSSNALDQFLFGKLIKVEEIKLIKCLDPSFTPPSSSLMNDMNNLNDEIDLLIGETSSNSPSRSSSAVENLSSWQNDYFQQNHFYPNFFPTNSTLSMSSPSTNIDTDNSTNHFASNTLTFM
jgi:hypothetical protein